MRKQRLTALLLSLLLLSLLLLLTACGRPAEPPAPPSDPPEVVPETPPEAPVEVPPESEPPWTWPEGLPEEQGVDPDALEAIHRELDGSPVHAALVIRHGVLVDEYYQEGYDDTSVFGLQSCSKSFTSTLVGIAIEEGYIEGVDVPLSDYFPEILETNPRYGGDMTLWHLLTHTTGIDASDRSQWEDWRGSENWVDYVLRRPSYAAPGASYRYFTGNTHLLAAILEKATGKGLLEYAREVLFDPLDMDSADCGTDPQGIGDGGNGFRMTARDMAKLGQLYLQGGTWAGEQVVPADWVAEATALQCDLAPGNPDYGYQWWLQSFGGYEAYFAQGHFGQFVFVVPELDLVAAFNSHNTGSNDLYWGLIREVIAACGG